MNDVQHSAAAVQRKLFNQAKVGRVSVSDNMTSLGAIVRESRERLGLSQAKLAHEAGVGRRFIADLEGGKETVRMKEVMLVCRHLNVNLHATVSILGNNRFEAYN